MMTEFQMEELSEFTKSVVHHKKLSQYVNQLEPNNKELQELHEKLLKLSRDGKYLDNLSYKYWCKVNYYIIDQMWGNTSCGWQGIGGAAMSNAYTYIIHNKELEVIFVYYAGLLAYIAKDDELLKPYMENQFHNLPGVRSCKDKLNIIYKSK